MTQLQAKPGRSGPSADVIVLGSGLAGLSAALSLAPFRVLLVTKTSELPGGSSFLAQGGIAAAVAEEDSAEEHAADTVAAGAGLCDLGTALAVAAEGPATIAFLERQGVVFDRDADDRLLLGREGAHGRNRILHAGGDAAGKHLTAALARAVDAAPHISLLTDTMAVDLAFAAGRLQGLWAVMPNGACKLLRAPRLVLATGGCGALWPATSNPPEATADGLALALRQGASAADLEFTQFHPTTLLTGPEANGRLPLLSEALRGAGALLLDGAGSRFMRDEHSMAELAPRDVVARAIWRRRLRGENVQLDLRPALQKRGLAAFPQAVAACRAAGFEPTDEPVPVTPAMHYHMGGIRTDQDGRTSLPGLWACGEVSATGLHGANRLASNSLLEAVVFARRAARDIHAQRCETAPLSELTPPPLPAGASLEVCRSLQTRMRRAVGRALGVERTGSELEVAVDELEQLEHRLQDQKGMQTTSDAAAIRTWLETRNMLLVARLMAMAALQRQESRGAHFRQDFPVTRETWARSIEQGLSELTETASEDRLHALG